MDAITLGPLFIPLERLVFAIAVIVVFAVSHWLERRHNLLGTMGLWVALGAGFTVGRLVHVAQYWAAYRPAPLEGLYLWQGGFNIWVGLAAAVVAAVAWGLWRKQPMSVTLAPVLAGAGAWGALMLALPIWQSQPDHGLPDILVSDMSGAGVSVADLGGEPLVVNLWATWCGPCRREMPVFQRAESEWPEVRFVYANQGENAGTVARFLQQEGLTLETVLLDRTGSLLSHFESHGLPTTAFFDASGQQVAQHAGEMSAARLHQYLTEMSP